MVAIITMMQSARFCVKVGEKTMLVDRDIPVSSCYVIIKMRGMGQKERRPTRNALNRRHRHRFRIPGNEPHIRIVDGPYL